jgi:long-chain acyl-CoA synthetase
VAAFVQPDPGYADAGNEPALKEEIIAFLKNRLAPYEMPKWIMFMKELPLTPVGKLDKKLLRKNAPHLLADSAGRD